MDILYLCSELQRVGQCPDPIRDALEKLLDHPVPAISEALTPAIFREVGQPGLCVAWRYRHKVPPAVLKMVPCVNLHPARLPWGRCADPVYWTARDSEPAGGTIHWMAPAFDRGNILAQVAVPVAPSCTLRELYGWIEAELARLLVQAWPAILAGDPGIQQLGEGSSHAVGQMPKLPGGWDTTVAEVRAMPAYQSDPARALALLPRLNYGMALEHCGLMMREIGKALTVGNGQLICALVYNRILELEGK